MDIANPSRRRLLKGAAVAAGATALGPLTVGTARAAGYPTTHWIPASTSNYTVSNRPTSYAIDRVIIHVTQEYFQDARRIFQDSARKVSAHYMLASADGYIAQFVREKDIAWHGGNWSYNTRSIGIEHEGWVDDPSWFTDVMYRQSAQLTAAICTRYGIPKDRTHIIGHYEVPGTDHTDPGPYWNWAKYMTYVKAAL
ncbi:N-acetylmuramoyl-L-alanine amidase [Streptomyces sp. A0642]|uniref:N-acetylmuramoyl-L-alanine amidase n=1 Tax=Streptomyces sp. A0642 TaxID=2563100 RepID=UPI0010A2A3A6|nr:N-acetylmuramoyl-L-alanine amidase [Streptomyces sp. A0642]THA76103.1 N-acetylmuramoyl-L-alanine amidase [Streptomyces sp. A0642]